jgi:hypothetical protein
MTSSGMYLSKQSIGVPLETLDRKRARKEVKILWGKNGGWIIHKRKERNKIKIESKKVLIIQNCERNIEGGGRK